MVNELLTPEFLSPLFELGTSQGRVILESLFDAFATHGVLVYNFDSRVLQVGDPQARLADLTLRGRLSLRGLLSRVLHHADCPLVLRLAKALFLLAAISRHWSITFSCHIMRIL